MMRLPPRLAILGAPPAFSEAVHVGRPAVGDQAAFLRRVDELLVGRRFTNGGPCVAELEARIARSVGVRHCVLVSSGTTALMLLARAAGLQGDVIVPAFTFVATAHAVDWIGLNPVFVDIDRASWNLDPAACEAAIGPLTSAILGVHVFGRPADIEALDAVASRHGLQLFFDASQAFGAMHRGRPIGSFGVAEVFSLHATKTFHTFEGGAITTDSGSLDTALRLLRNFGFRDLDDVSSPGINGKMPEVCAAMGLSNLDVFDDTMTANRITFEAYRAGLAGIPGLVLRDEETTDLRNFHMVVVEVDEVRFGMSRDALVRVLTAENVLVRRYFHPGVHAMEPYRGRDPFAAARLPVTVEAASRVAVLPAGPEIAADTVSAICDLIRTAQALASQVLAALASASHADRL